MSVEILEGHLLTVVLGDSAKARDLQADGRYALHTHQDPAKPDEFQVRGRASVVTDAAFRARAAATWQFEVGDEDLVRGAPDRARAAGRASRRGRLAAGLPLVAGGGCCPDPSLEQHDLACRLPRPQAVERVLSSAGVLESRRDAVDRRTDDRADGCRRGARLARGLGPPQAAQQLDLDGRQGVDVGVPEHDRAGEGRVPVEQPVPARDEEQLADRAGELGLDRGSGSPARPRPSPGRRSGGRSRGPPWPATARRCRGRTRRTASGGTGPRGAPGPRGRPRRRPPRGPCRGRTSRAGWRAPATTRRPTGSRAARRCPGRWGRSPPPRAAGREDGRDPSPRPGIRSIGVAAPKNAANPGCSSRER